LLHTRRAASRGTLTGRGLWLIFDTLFQFSDSKKVGRCLEMPWVLLN
jgi:hypothetical protein